MESIVREKAWIVKTLSSLYKDGEHIVVFVDYFSIMINKYNIFVGFTSLI